MSVAVRPTCCRSPISMFQNHQHNRTSPITVPGRITLHVFFKRPSKPSRKRTKSGFSNCGPCCAARSRHARTQAIIRAHQHTSNSTEGLTAISGDSEVSSLYGVLRSTRTQLFMGYLKAFRVSSWHLLKTPLGSRVQPCMFAAWHGVGEFADGFSRLIDVDIPRYMFSCSENSVW